MEYVIQYGLFLAKTVTIVVAIIIVLGTMISMGARGRIRGKDGEITVTRLNDRLDNMRDILKEAILDKEVLKSESKKEKKRLKNEEKARKKKRKQHDDAPEDEKKRVYVLNFNGDIAASAVTCLREEITAVLSLATPNDEILLRLESPGGMVHAYGLASSQLSRIKSKKIPLVICVDKVAASGGYMMACLADRLVAAPFAILGSIGVLVQMPNFHRLLKKVDVDYQTISAGEFKTTLTTFGEITEKGKAKVQEDVEDMHVLFKKWVKDHRPSVDIDKIATGETWVGIEAVDKYMVDEIKTSDECIVAACENADVYEVTYELRKSLSDKLGNVFHTALDKTLMSWWRRTKETSYFS